MADSGTQKKITPQQARAIQTLLLARDAKSAAAALGIGERTMRRWMKETAFKAALEAAEGEALRSAVRRLTAAADIAVDTLLDCTRLKHEAGVRVRAALGILGRLRDLRELGDLETRLTALEAQLAEARQPAAAPNGRSNGKLHTAIASSGNGRG